MTTEPSSPMSARSKFALLLIAFMYSWCTYTIVVAIGHPINWTAATVGIVAPFVIRDLPLLRKLPGWAIIITAALALNFVVPDHFAHGIELGLAALIAVGAPLWIIGWIVVRLTADIPVDVEDDTPDEQALEPDTLPEVPKRVIVGLSGYAGAGKDTAAEALIALGYTRVSFADKIREVMLGINMLIPVVVPGIGGTPHTTTYMRLDNFLESCGGDWTLAKRNLEVRGLAQRTGTDGGRNVLGENIWVDAVMKNLPEGNIVFTDMRFPNEYEAIVNSPGGIVVRIVRPGVNAVNAHVSETALDGYLFNATIENTQDRDHVGLVLAAFLQQSATPQLMP
jgi:hypothetical protein